MGFNFDEILNDLGEEEQKSEKDHQDEITISRILKEIEKLNKNK